MTRIILAATPRMTRMDTRLIFSFSIIFHRWVSLLCHWSYYTLWKKGSSSSSVMVPITDHLGTIEFLSDFHWRRSLLFDRLGGIELISARKEKGAFIRILLIEDNDDIQEILYSLLRKIMRSFSFFQVQKGCGSFQQSLIWFFLDIMLPGKMGDQGPGGDPFVAEQVPVITTALISNTSLVSTPCRCQWWSGARKRTKTRA